MQTLSDRLAALQQKPRQPSTKSIDEISGNRSVSESMRERIAKFNSTDSKPIVPLASFASSVVQPTDLNIPSKGLIGNRISSFSKSSSPSTPNHIPSSTSSSQQSTAQKNLYSKDVDSKSLIVEPPSVAPSSSDVDIKDSIDIQNSPEDISTNQQQTIIDNSNLSSSNISNPPDLEARQAENQDLVAHEIREVKAAEILAAENSDEIDTPDFKNQSNDSSQKAHNNADNAVNDLTTNSKDQNQKEEITKDEIEDDSADGASSRAPEGSDESEVKLNEEMAAVPDEENPEYIEDNEIMNASIPDISDAVTESSQIESKISSESKEIDCQQAKIEASARKNSEGDEIEDEISSLRDEEGSIPDIAALDLDSGEVDIEDQVSDYAEDAEEMSKEPPLINTDSQYVPELDSAIVIPESPNGAAVHLMQQELELLDQDEETADPIVVVKSESLDHDEEIEDPSDNTSGLRVPSSKGFKSDSDDDVSMELTRDESLIINQKSDSNAVLSAPSTPMSSKEESFHTPSAATPKQQSVIGSSREPFIAKQPRNPYADDDGEISAPGYAMVYPSNS